MIVKEANLEANKSIQKKKIDTRIEALKASLEQLRGDLHSEIDEKFAELR